MMEEYIRDHDVGQDQNHDQRQEHMAVQNKFIDAHIAFVDNDEDTKERFRKILKDKERGMMIISFTSMYRDGSLDYISIRSEKMTRLKEKDPEIYESIRALDTNHEFGLLVLLNDPELHQTHLGFDVLNFVENIHDEPSFSSFELMRGPATKDVGEPLTFEQIFNNAYPPSS